MADQNHNLILKSRSALHTVSSWVSYVGMATVIIMMLMVVVDVALRFFIGKPILGSVELASYMLSIIAFTAIPLVESEEMHVSIPLVFDRFPQKVRLWINSLVNLIGLGLLILLSWSSFLLAFEHLRRGKVTQVLHIPLYPFVFIAAVCVTLYGVILIVNSLTYIYLKK